MSGKKLTASLIVSLLFLTGVPVAASAANAPSGVVATGLFNQGKPPYAPETIPLFADVLRQQGKVYYLGERSGLTGWLVSKSGQIQLLYVTQDRHSIVVGGLFTDAGDSISSPQMSQLAQTNKEVEALLTPSAMQQRDVTVAGAVAGGAASVPSDYESGQTIGNVLPAVSLSPGERLIMDLRAASSVTTGADGKPELFMLVDAKCNKCQEMWHELRGPLKEGKMQLHLIPTTVGPESTENMRQMAMLLQAQDPFAAWEKFIGGKQEALAGTPDALRVKAVGANRAMMDRWSIQAVPYLVYRSSKDHQIKIVQGKPNRMASIMAGLLGQ